MPECLLIKRQARGLQPYLKRDFDADFFPVNVEEFSKDLAEPIQHFIQRSKNALFHSTKYSLFHSTFHSYDVISNVRTSNFE